MVDFSNFLNLPLIWGALIAIALFIYVLLDGFDLGCGIITVFAPTQSCRNRIMNSIAPFWDGNETWLVMAGGGLFVAFPPAYGIILSALYLPIILMLIGLIFRGVSFEFQYKARTLNQRRIWLASFHFGSLLAAIMQGVILGNLIQGVEVYERQYSGGPLDWINGMSVFTGVAMIFGYALIGATWLIMKTDGTTQVWAKLVAKYAYLYVGIFLFIITISMPIIDSRIANLWFQGTNFFYLLPIPLLALGAYSLMFKDLFSKQCIDYRPFVMTVLLFFSCFIGICFNLYPWIVPYEMTLASAAAAPTSQSLILIGAAIFLPIVLFYTGFVYYVFRGKTDDKPPY